MFCKFLKQFIHFTWKGLYPSLKFMFFISLEKVTS